MHTGIWFSCFLAQMSKLRKTKSYSWERKERMIWKGRNISYVDENAGIYKLVACDLFPTRIQTPKSDPNAKLRVS